MRAQQPAVGVDAAAVLDAILARTKSAARPFAPASMLSVLVAMVGNDPGATQEPDGTCRFRAESAEIARQLTLPPAQVEAALWLFINAAKIVGASQDGSSTTYVLGARYTAVSAIAGHVEWSLVLSQLQARARAALSLAVLRVMLDGYPADATLETLIEPHAPRVTTADLARSLQCDARDVREAFTTLKSAGIWDSARSVGRNKNTWRWHPQIFGLAPFVGDTPLVSAEALAQAREAKETVSPPAIAPANSQLVADLQALADLYKQELLSFDEFVAAKARLLA